MKIIVIGAGASGIIASLKLSEKHEVILLEKNDKIGKKILVTGNGKCNLWNTNLFNKNINEYYYTDNYEVLNKILENKKETFNYLTQKLNIFTREKNGYMYPYSNSAASIRALFEKELMNNKNIKTICNFEVTKIEQENNKFKVYGNDEVYESDKVVISVGGMASKFGTNSINLLNNIIINKCVPSLVPLTSDEKYLKEISGIRVDTKLSVFENNKLIKEETGELQFTDYGISGIVTLNISGLFSKKNNLKLYIDFLPGVDIEKMFNNFPNKKIEDILETIFNYKLMFVLLKKVGINKDRLFNSLTKEEKNNLIKIIKEFNINITGTLSFDRAQVMAGGISLDEIDGKLMIKKIPNLYVTGEILDVDGICGGYNLAFAFISGFLVGKMINDKN